MGNEMLYYIMAGVNILGGILAMKAVAHTVMNYNLVPYWVKHAFLGMGVLGLMICFQFYTLPNPSSYWLAKTSSAGIWILVWHWAYRIRFSSIKR